MSKSESFQDILQTYYRRDLGRMYPPIQPDQRRLTAGGAWRSACKLPAAQGRRKRAPTHDRHHTVTFCFAEPMEKTGPDHGTEGSCLPPAGRDYFLRGLNHHPPAFSTLLPSSQASFLGEKGLTPEASRQEINGEMSP